MSRDETIFTKRAVVIVAVLSTLGGWGAQALSAGWRARDEVEQITQKATVAATAAAISAATAAVAPVHDEVLKHVYADDERVKAIDRRLSVIEKREGIEP